MFKESSLEKLKLKESNKLRQNLEKGSYLSSVNLRNRLFGINHPYGRVLSSEDIFALTVESVRAFHERFTNQFEIYLSGNIPDVALKCLDGFHSDDLKKPNSVKNYDPIIEDSIIRSNKFVQSSIKIGKRLFTRSHTEYYPFIVMNGLLGGYFGSRLMNNIREEKGLTYGIYSHLYSLHYDGYFLISSDIKSENETEVLEEIYKEITLLQSELVSEQELETVKNYMIGTFANSLSSPFGIIEKNKVLISQNLSTEFYSNYIKNVNNINAEDVTTMASKHLKIDTFTKSIVGNQKS